MTSENRCTRAVGHVIHRARYYNPATGTFNQRDAFGGDNEDPQSLHKYAYAHSDPVNMIDPSGNMVVGGAIELNLVALIYFVGFMMVAAVLWSVLMNTQLRTQIFEASRQLVAAAGELISAGGHAIAEAYAAVAAAAAALVSQMSKVMRAVREAINEAVKLGKQTLKELIKIPKYLIIRSLGKTIFDFNVACLAARPDWFLLNYLGPGMQGPNRAWIRSTYAAWYPAPAGYQVDEFPYASTREGGPRGPALVHYAPWLENAVQGGTLGAFYRFSRLRGRPGTFLVVPVPL